MFRSVNIKQFYSKLRYYLQGLFVLLVHFLVDSTTVTGGDSTLHTRSVYTDPTVATLRRLHSSNEQAE
jgi:hypothetical protein